jgi:hypothetical protein
MEIRDYYSSVYSAFSPFFEFIKFNLDRFFSSLVTRWTTNLSLFEFLQMNINIEVDPASVNSNLPDVGNVTDGKYIQSEELEALQESKSIAPDKVDESLPWYKNK